MDIEQNCFSHASMSLTYGKPAMTVYFKGEQGAEPQTWLGAGILKLPQEMHLKALPNTQGRLCLCPLNYTPHRSQRTMTTLPTPKHRASIRNTNRDAPAKHTHRWQTSSSYTERTGNLTPQKRETCNTERYTERRGNLTPQKSEKCSAEHYVEHKGNLSPQKKGKHTSSSYTEHTGNLTPQRA